jgi:oligopeptide transport system substrate-binding protein
LPIGAQAAVFPRLKTCLSLLAAALLGLLAGCARHETAVESGTRGQILHIGNRDEPADLDPHTNNASTTNYILGTLFEGLVEYNNDGTAIVPGVAERWEISADGLTYTFHLRANARWSNGDPVTAQDFRDSFLRVLDPALGCEEANQAFPILGARDFLEGRSTDPRSVGVRAPDPRTFVTILGQPAAYWLSTLAARGALRPVHFRSVDAAGGRHQRGGAWTRAGQLVGNGPFVLAEWRPNALIRVVRNPQYWDAARVRLQEIRFYPTDDENAEERSYRAGQLHMTYRVPEPKVAKYERERPAELQISPELRTSYLTFNVTRPPFTDARVRRAFSLAVNREALVGATLGKLALPAAAMVHPGTGGYTVPNLVRFDPAEARRLLAEAGFPGGAGLPAIEFTLNGNTGVTLLVASALQEMWSQNLGVHVSLLPVEFKVYLSLCREKQLQLLLDGWGYGIPDPRDVLELATTGDPNNDSAWSDRGYDALFARSDRTSVPAERQALFDAMETALAREVPYAPLYQMNQGFLLHPSVHGLQPNLLQAIDWREIWLEPPK